MEGRWKVCVWGLIIFLMKGVVIRVSRMESLAPTDSMSVAWKSRWRVLHAGQAMVWEVDVTSLGFNLLPYCIRALAILQFFKNQI